MNIRRENIVTAFRPRTLAGLGDPISTAMATWASSPSPISSIGNFSFYGGFAAVATYFLFFRGKHHRSGSGGYHAPKTAPAAPATATNRRRRYR